MYILFKKKTLTSIAKGSIHNKEALIKIVACRLFGDKPLPEPVMTLFIDKYILYLA